MKEEVKASLGEEAIALHGKKIEASREEEMIRLQNAVKANFGQRDLR